MNFFEYLNDECTKSLAALALDCDGELIVTICNNIISVLNEIIDDKVEMIHGSNILFFEINSSKIYRSFFEEERNYHVKLIYKI